MRTILLIDDERPTLNMLSLFLEAYGFASLTAENGEEGIELFKKERPQIVMTDIKMPGMDGIEVLKQIKSLSPATEVIMVTGHGDMDLAIKALNLSATDFINKPVKKEALEAALRRAEERLDAGGTQGNEIQFDERDGVTLMHIHGNVTAGSEPYLQEACDSLIGKSRIRVLLIFDENASINGAGIALLTQLLLECSGKGLQLAITGLSDNFHTVFDIVGITRFASLHKKFDDALASLAEQ